jgi:hypothetical protein
VAKNKNQNRRRDQRDERRHPAAEPQEHVPDTAAQEHGMPAATQVTRRQQKRFGHN